MILTVHGMTFSDQLLLQYLQVKASHCDGVHLRYEEIVLATGMSPKTVQRSMCRLENAGLIIRIPYVGKSYLYKVINRE